VQIRALPPDLDEVFNKEITACFHELNALRESGVVDERRGAAEKALAEQDLLRERMKQMEATIDELEERLDDDSTLTAAQTKEIEAELGNLREQRKALREAREASDATIDGLIKEKRARDSDAKEMFDAAIARRNKVHDSRLLPIDEVVTAAPSDAQRAGIDKIRAKLAKLAQKGCCVML
jgi:chromosome segregation ATPase